MKLIGALKSPYVRRTAICLEAMGMDFEVVELSAFEHFDQFSDYNPIVRAPTLICDNGDIIMDSSLIIQYCEGLAPTPLLPSSINRSQEFQCLSLAMAACDKSIQYIYETQLRPADKRLQHWQDRVESQAQAAFQQLERALPSKDALEECELSVAFITSAVVWKFVSQATPHITTPTQHPGLHTLSIHLERHALFRKYPAPDYQQPTTTNP